MRSRRVFKYPLSIRGVFLHQREEPPPVVVIVEAAGLKYGPVGIGDTVIIIDMVALDARSQSADEPFHIPILEESMSGVYKTAYAGGQRIYKAYILILIKKDISLRGYADIFNTEMNAAPGCGLGNFTYRIMHVCAQRIPVRVLIEVLIGMHHHGISVKIIIERKSFLKSLGDYPVRFGTGGACRVYLTERPMERPVIRRKLSLPRGKLRKEVRLHGGKMRVHCKLDADILITHALKYFQQKFIIVLSNTVDGDHKMFHKQQKLLFISAAIQTAAPSISFYRFLQGPQVSLLEREYGSSSFMGRVCPFSMRSTSIFAACLPSSSMGICTVVSIGMK